MGFVIVLFVALPLLMNGGLIKGQQAVTDSYPSYDPCNNYTSLNQPWRANNGTGSNICDRDFNWNGWYRMFYYGMNIRMPESCVPTYRCGTYYPLWLNGSHPQIEDGVVTRQVCGNEGSDCCYFKSAQIRVKACPDNYYVYELVHPTGCYMAYCTDASTITLTTAPTMDTGAESSTTTTLDSALDPCNYYTVLDDIWRTTYSSYGYGYYTYGSSSYYSSHDDSVTEWNGWYRLFLQGADAQIAEWCVNSVSSGGYTPLFLGGSHPLVKDGIVSRTIYGSNNYVCNYYSSNSIRVKACPGHYYVYKLVKPDVSIPMPTYTAVASNRPTYNPCNNYTSLDQPWRANNKTNLGICDSDFNWNGWYRLFHHGMNIRMPESCVNISTCGTSYPLWLNGPHPQIEDGEVTRQVCGNLGSDCCYYKSIPIRVRACPDNYYVYEFESPISCNMAYCTDAKNITPALPTEANGVQPNMTMIPTTNNSTFDPCNNYTVLDDNWRDVKGYYRGHDDTLVEWNGWYRLNLQGESAQMSEWCVSYMTCGGYTPLSLGGSHPQVQDGIVTREVYGSNGSQCTTYRSKPIQVKACPGDYYVYKFVRPDIAIPMPSYCAVIGSHPSYDPCNNYTSLDQPWRANNETGLNICDSNFIWNGWYRLFYYGMNIRMPESCVPTSRCGTYYPLWLNGPHPQIEDGVVIRQVCGNGGSDCYYIKSFTIRVKACPGDYYVYEFVSPNSCNMAYCSDSNTTNSTSDSTTAINNEESNMTMTTTPDNSTFDPCHNYTILSDIWRTTYYFGFNYYSFGSSSYFSSHDDTLVPWNGWYRLYLQGASAQIAEWCLNSITSGGYTPLFLKGSHPRLMDGIVTRDIYGYYSHDRYTGQCNYYRSKPIQVKACAGQYYVYKLVKPDVSIPMPTYTAVAINRFVSDDPCNNYVSLDQPWRANNRTGLNICDRNFNWNGWYRMFYRGMNIHMPESCVPTSRCGTSYPLWLDGPHPEIEDGVVIRQVCGSTTSDCCFYKSTPIKVKACPGSYYVYEFVSPTICNAAYCTDASTITPSPPSETNGGQSNTTTSPTPNNSTFDPCTNYRVLNDYWRGAEDNSGHDDTLVEWNGWYRLNLQGKSAQLPEWCVSFMMCGGYTPLSLGGAHPQPEDGIVTREVYGSNGTQCTTYRSKPIQVKACAGDYYVYEFIKPDIFIPMPSYCAVTAIHRPSYDPCNNYTSLDQPWRANNETGSNICDSNFEWNGWYRLFYRRMNIRMSESCVPYYRCGTSFTLWLNGPHPQIEDGVVTRQLCGNAGYDCYYYKSTTIQVKACPGNYYVYELVRPDRCNMAYCTDSSTIRPTSDSATEEEFNMSMTTSPVNFTVDPCDSYTALDDIWRIPYSTFSHGYYASGTSMYYGTHDDSIPAWNGWYRLFLQGKNAQIPEWCVSTMTSGGHTLLLLSDSHPLVKDGIVTRDIYGTYDLGYYTSQCRGYVSNPIQVKACPGHYYVYKLVKPNLSIPMPVYTAVVSSSLNFDPCYNYTALDQPWRANNETGLGVCDIYFPWNGWYRMFYYGVDIRMPESCVPTSRCGTYFTLWLNGPHPQIEDGVVTRQVCGISGSDCCYYRSIPIQVKACPDNYYVYKFVQPTATDSRLAYCTDATTIAETSVPTTMENVTDINMTTATSPTEFTVDPCDNYTMLDDIWRTTYSFYGYGYYTYGLNSNYSSHDDTLTEWNGWYRLFLQGADAQIAEWCVNFVSSGGYTPLFLGGSHPLVQDSIVTRDIYGPYSQDYLNIQCNYYRSKPIQVKACPGHYYVYKLVRPSLSIPLPTYTAVALPSPAYDPCTNYTALDQPWRANNQPQLGICDSDFNWNGWYRFFHYGMDIQMPESCVPAYRCGTSYTLWLNGPHPQIEDGVVTRQVCGNGGSDCCYYKSALIHVKACPGNYFVYKLIKPPSCNSTYCTDASTLIPTPASPTESDFVPSDMTTTPTIDFTFDPCNNYTVLDNDWRDTKSYSSKGHDDTLVEWNGWYRLYLQRASAQMSEWCVSFMTCGGYTPLSLAGAHPQPEDGIVIREVYGSNGTQCTTYRSNPIQVKACPGDYYVYKFIKPDISIPMPSYCAVTVNHPNYDPCNNYTSLDQPWRANNESGMEIADEHFPWNGWYRFLFYGQDIRMPESCVPMYRCGTNYPVWLNGPHPQIRDGVVTRQICGNQDNNCYYARSLTIQMKACPDNYYVYELVRPYSYRMSYCTDSSSITPASVPPTNDEFNINTNLDPCNNYTVLNDSWRTTYSSYSYKSYDDTLVKWNGWYRLYLQDKSAQLSEACVGYISCGGFTPLALNDSHPLIQDGIVSREVYGARYSECRYYRSNPIQVKACPGHYYVYRLVRPDISIPMPTYCAVAFNSPSYDPCNNYTSLDQPWRASTKIGLKIYDAWFSSWNGWYRMFYYGKNIRMPESCVPTDKCGTYYPLWLNGPHPKIEDGVVARQVCGNSGHGCCYFQFFGIQVKACPGNYYVYEIVSPYYYFSNSYYSYYYSNHNYYYESAMAYCTDASNITPTLAPPITDTGFRTTMTITPTNYSFDPCDNYTVLDDYWRGITSSYGGHGNDDTLVDWHGWYRLYLQGKSAQMSEWCVNSISCGGYTPLILGGPHPQIEDGIVTRNIHAFSEGNCNSLSTSNPIQVKACPGQYYVYKLVKPDISIPIPAYCTVSFTYPSTDPCHNYNVLSDTYRLTTSPNPNYYWSWYRCDANNYWTGWYRFLYQGNNARMPESCVSPNSCETPIPLWLKGGHPRLEEGVVSRQVCGSTTEACCYHKSFPIQVKACPGNYYVYEFVRPVTCSVYCIDVGSFTPTSAPEVSQTTAIIESAAVVTSTVTDFSPPTIPENSETAAVIESTSEATTTTTDVSNIPTSTPENSETTAIITSTVIDTTTTAGSTTTETNQHVSTTVDHSFTTESSTTETNLHEDTTVQPSFTTDVTSNIPTSTPENSTTVIKSAATTAETSTTETSQIDNSSTGSNPTTASCVELNCTEDEWCGERDGLYGCFCNENHPRPRHESYDSRETCESSSGTMSLSRCQLFEAGFPANVLHLSDPSCNGTLQNGRLVFHFDNDENVCGTNLMANGTHFIYENSIQGVSDSAHGPINRKKHLELHFACVYQLSQTSTMETSLNTLQSMVHKAFPDGQGMYQVRIIPYEDAAFSHPYNGSAYIELDQRIYVGVNVQGVDSRQISTVMDSCWATPVNEQNFDIRWDLIINKCPNPDDSTVEVLQNGVSTDAHFSFKMFSFNGNYPKIFLHCSIHLCLLQGGNCDARCLSGHPHRVGRSVDIHDRASISVGPFTWTAGSTGD